MSLQSDATISLKKETTFDTVVTPDISYEFVEEDLTWMPTFAQGVGTRYQSRVASSEARVLVKEESGGSFTVEGKTKGLGKLFEAAFGVGVSTLVAGSAFQQLFTPIADDFLPSYTIQKGIPLIGAAMAPHTFSGMVCNGFEMTADNGGIPRLKFNWIGKSFSTVPAFATPTYAASTRLLSFIDGSVQIAGAVTPPTTTALSSGGTATANIRSFDLAYSNGLDSEGFNFGSGGKRARKPTVDQRSITGNLVAEYDTNTLRDAWIAQSDLAIVLRFKTSILISGTSFPTLEITIPLARLEGDIPKAVRAGGGVTTQSIPFTVLDGRVAAQPIYAAIVTSETAI